MQYKTYPPQLMLAVTIAALVVGILALLPVRAAHAGTVRYAKPDGSTTDTACSTWETACTLTRTLQVAIWGDEVWVKAGLYKPGTTQGSYFWLKNGVALYGGFTGLEHDRNERNWQTNITVLSGDIGSDDRVDANGIVTDTANISGTNALHVVYGNQVTSTAVLDGFTITAGSTLTGTACPGFGGGGIYLYNGDYAGPTLRNLTIRGNRAINGGGVYLNRSSPMMDHVTISDNLALITGTLTAYNCGLGGGMYAYYLSNPTMSYMTVENNKAKVAAGIVGMYSTLNLTDSSVSHNTAINNHSALSGICYSCYGGGLSLLYSSLYTSGQSVLTRDTFDSNIIQTDPTQSNDAGGAGIYINTSAVTIADSSVTNNAAPVPGWSTQHVAPASFGGGLTIYGSNPILQRVTIFGNSAIEGGGIYNGAKGNPTLTDVTFHANTATDCGGGIVAFSDNTSGIITPTLRNVSFTNNVAGSNVAGPNGGGGMYNANLSHAILENVTFTGNSGGLGGAFYNDFGSPTLKQVTLFQNTAVGFDLTVGGGGDKAPGLGGGIYNDVGSSIQISNGILWGNTAISGTSQLLDQVYSANVLSTTLGYSLVQGGFTGAGNLDADPLFGPLGTYGGLTPVLPLLPGSAAIDAAQDSACLATDQRGVGRVQGAHCDMGAFESRGWTLTKSSGDNQTTAPGTAFPIALGVTVSANAAGEPMNGGRIIFTAPGSGASTNPTVYTATIAGGAVSQFVTANGQAGPYSVQAATTGAPAIFFALTNGQSVIINKLFIPLIRK